MRPVQNDRSWLAGKHQQQPERLEDDPERTNADFDAVVKCMGELIEEGLIKAWGLSNETTFGVCKWCASCLRGAAALLRWRWTGDTAPRPPRVCAGSAGRRCSTAEKIGVPKPVSIQNDFSLLVRSISGLCRHPYVSSAACRQRLRHTRALAHLCVCGGCRAAGALQDRRFDSELAEACSDRHYNLGLLVRAPDRPSSSTTTY